MASEAVDPDGDYEEDVKVKITSRFSVGQIAELDRKAKREGISRAEATRRAVDLYLGQSEMEAVVLREGEAKIEDGMEPNVALTNKDGNVGVDVRHVGKVIDFITNPPEWVNSLAEWWSSSGGGM